MSEAAVAAAVKCAYPGCDGDAGAARGAGHCGKCLRPLRICGDCGAANQSLALFCRRCAKEVKYSGFGAAALGPDVLAGAFSRSPKVTLFGQTFACAPAVFGGFVWALSSTGELWRFTPASTLDPKGGRVASQCSLGAGFGDSPMALGHFPGRGGVRVPLVLAISEGAIKAWNLVTGESPYIVAESGAGRFWASMSAKDDERYVGVVCHGARVFALYSGKEEGVALFSAGTEGGNTWRGEIGKGPIAGPLVIDDRVCCYSQDTVYWEDEGTVKSQKLGAGIVRLIVSPREAPGFQRPAGAFPWVLAPRGAYLPAQSDGRYGLAWVRFSNGRPVCQVIRLEPDSSYSQAADGRLLVCKRGCLMLYEDGGGAPQFDDQQMSPSGVEFFDDPLYLYLASVAGGKVLRASVGRSFSRDEQIPRARGAVTMVRCANAGGAFVLPFFDAGLDIGVATWLL
jgi:hypothetical protein